MMEATIDDIIEDDNISTSSKDSQGQPRLSPSDINRVSTIKKAMYDLSKLCGNNDAVADIINDYPEAEKAILLLVEKLSLKKKTEEEKKEPKKASKKPTLHNDIGMLISYVNIQN